MIIIEKIESFVINLIFIFPILYSVEGAFNSNFKLPHIMLVILALLILLSKVKKDIFYLIFIIILIVIQEKFFKYNIDRLEMFLFCDFLLITTYACSNFEKIKRQFDINIKVIFIIYTTLVFIFLITFVSGSGWIYVWGGKQFIGLIPFPHDACYFFSGLQACFIVFYFKFNNRKIKVISFGVNSILMVFALLTNARTPFVLSGFLYIFFLYKVLYKKYVILYFTIVIPLSIVLLGILFKIIDIEFLSRLPIFDKFMRGIEMGNVSSSRDIMWENIMSYYNNYFDMTSKVIGKGTGLTRQLNYKEMGQNLWAHNDFIEILVSMGYLGIGAYGYSIIRFLIKSRNILFTIIVVIVAFSNGIFVYPQFTIFIPIIIYAFIVTKKKVLV